MKLRVSLFASIVFYVFLAQQAAAKFEFCNATQSKQSVSIAYKDGGDWVSKGWWNISPGGCKTVLGGDLKSRYYYYRATVNGGNFKGQNYYFCTEKKPYTIKGKTDCESRGYRKEEFSEIDTGKTAKSYKLTLVPPKGSAKSQPKAAPKAPAPKQGSLGEPFTTNGVFQGCSKDACTFHADGWKWYAFRGAGTPKSLMSEMSRLPAGIAVTIKGDILSYGDISVEVAAYSIQKRRATDFENTVAGLQGKWKDGNDPKQVWVIQGSEIYEYYDGQGTGESFFQITNTCEEAQGRKGPFLRRIIPEDHQNPLCYFLLGWDAEFLQLAYAGSVNGATMDFWKQY